MNSFNIGGGIPQTSSPTPWILTAFDHQQAEGHFVVLRPQNGKLTGEQSKPFFLKSGLAPGELAQIWQLSDLNRDGLLDRLEFSIAFKLIRNRLAGLAMPTSLPDSMKQISGPPPPQPIHIPPRPLSAYGSLSMGSSPNLYMAAAGGPAGMGGIPQMQMRPGNMPAPSAQFGSSTSLGKKELHDWTMPQSLKLRFSQRFNQLDKNRVGLLNGAQARGVLDESQLSTAVLAQIWNLADVTRDGCLSVEEFCTAMFFIEMLKTGYALPQTLPPELAAFCHRSKTTSPMGFAASEDEVEAVNPGDPPPQKAGSIKTFEDKRKDNFDRGQAELERRRQILFEEEQRRKAEIERREREEAERRERERQELERRREAEKQVERLRELELERARAVAEERTKTEREEARRQMEIGRLKELEKSRIHQLEQQLASEMEKTLQMEQRHKTMTFQLQALDEKAQSLNSEITSARDEILGITGEIEKMREVRDQKLLKIAEIEQKTQALSVQYQRISHETLQLETDCQQSMSRSNECVALNSQLEMVKDSIESTKTELEATKKKSATQEKLVLDKRQDHERSKQKLHAIATEYNSVVEQLNAKKRELGIEQAPKQENNFGRSHLEESPKKVPPVAAAGQFYDFPPSETTTAGQFYDFPPESNASEQHQVLQKLSTTSGAEEPWPPLTSSVPPPSNNNKDPFAPTADPFAAVGVVAPSMPPTSDPFASGASSAEFGFVADFSSAFGAGGNPWATGAAAEAANFTNDPFAPQSTPKEASQSNFAKTEDPFGAPQNMPAKQEGTTVNPSAPQQGGKPVKTVKYRAKFEFRARSDDELSIQPGDTIIVFEGHDSEPGWLAGQIKNKVGWFPAEFAEPIGAPASTGVLKRQSTLTSSPSGEPLARIEEEPSSVIAPSEAVSSSELLKSVGKTPTKPDANFSQAFSKSVKIGDLNATNVATKPSAASAQPPLYYDLPPGDQQTLAQTKSPLFQQSSQAPSSTTFSGKIMDSEKNGGESVSPELTASVLGLATAQYQWKARNETELSFARGDIIEILEKGEMRWRGRLQKNRVVQGWFPKSYVRLDAAVTADETNTMETAINNAKNSATLSTNTATALPTNLSAHQKRASISGGTSKPTTNDASLDGSTIKKSSSTSEGLLLQRAALTPQTNGAFGHKENNNSTNKSESKTSLTGEKRVDVSRSAAGNETHQEKNYEVPPNDSAGSEDLYVALYNFDPVETTDLSLRAGDQISVLEKVGEWWKGSCRGKSGIFPANYVQKVQGETAAVAATNPPAADVTPAEMVGRAIADFTATAANQVSLKAGDLVRVHNTSPAGWWEGAVEHEGASKTGWFPGNYIKIIAPQSGSQSGSPVAIALYDYTANCKDELTFKTGEQIEVMDQTDQQWWRGRKVGSTGDDVPSLIFPSSYVQLQ